MKITKWIISVILIAALIFSFFILIKTFCIQEWNTVASSLAVITAIIGSWSAQRIIWKQQEELEPNIIVYLDLKSRSECTQFVIENKGGGTAYDVKIEWERELRDTKNSTIRFKSGKDNIDFTQMPKGQKFTYFVGITNELFKRDSPLEYYGKIKFKKSSQGILNFTNEFFISLEPFRISLNTENDLQEFYKQNTFIHKDLKEINKTLNELSEKIKDKNK